MYTSFPLPFSGPQDRSTTAVPPTEHMTGEVPLESHPATVTTASAAKDDDVTEYEAGFRLVEQYNIVSVSGSFLSYF